ncbi:unnamed protein product [Macrosiphum euphorbiae]|uniref:Uncharacterized protein n=1 Tax=Macrosiphum euphorbiae TaxID=13131 RepID=A0AAV0W291_9HEMI|nr:unnamed protein product [Macrosiphum euphorbiae]
MLSKQLWRSFAARNKIVNGLFKHNQKKTQSSSIVTRNASNRNSDIDAELNKPVKYTTSPANDWKAQHSRLGSKAEFGPCTEAMDK